MFEQSKEQHIIERLQNGDSKVVEVLYDNYGAALYGIILNVVHDEATAADLLQTVFLKIWRNRARFDAAKGRLFTWMLNIARRTAIDKVRSKGYKNRQKTQPLDNTVYDNDRLKYTLSPELIGIKDTLQHLDPKYRIVLDYIYFKGYTFKELSEELDIPMGTAKSRARIALRELRKVLRIK